MDDKQTQAEIERREYLENQYMGYSGFDEYNENDNYFEDNDEE